MSNKGTRASEAHHRNAVEVDRPEPDRVTFFIAKIEKDDLAYMSELLESGKVRTVIDRRYELSRARDALRYLGERHARGKVVITV